MCQITSNLKRNRNVYLAVLHNGNAAMKQAARVAYEKSIEKAKEANVIDQHRHASLINESKGCAA